VVSKILIIDEYDVCKDNFALLLESLRFFVSGLKVIHGLIMNDEIQLYRACRGRGKMKKYKLENTQFPAQRYRPVRIALSMDNSGRASFYLFDEDQGRR